MTMEQAIELNEALSEYLLEKGLPIMARAAGLGTEALKTWQDCRRKGLVPLGWVLPGETKGDA